MGFAMSVSLLTLVPWRYHTGRCRDSRRSRPFGRICGGHRHLGRSGEHVSLGGIVLAGIITPGGRGLEVGSAVAILGRFHIP